MKINLTLSAFVLSALILINISCSKKNDVKQDVLIDEKDLTACPLNTTCTSRFSIYADVDSTRPFVKDGDYRVFWNSKVTADDETFLLIKAPMKGTSFVLAKKDILNGSITLIRSCPACYSVGFKITDGYVKGLNLNPDKSADQTRWIIEAKIIREAEFDASYKDTVYIKQYFYPNFVIN